MALLMGKGDLYPFSDYLKNYEEKSKGAVKPEIFNLISSQPLVIILIIQSCKPNHPQRGDPARLPSWKGKSCARQR